MVHGSLVLRPFSPDFGTRRNKRLRERLLRMALVSAAKSKSLRPSAGDRRSEFVREKNNFAFSLLVCTAERWRWVLCIALPNALLFVSISARGVCGNMMLLTKLSCNLLITDVSFCLTLIAPFLTCSIYRFQDWPFLYQELGTVILPSHVFFVF